MVDFRDSRIALYNGSKSVTVIQSSGDSETDDTNPEFANPLDLYLQRQPTLRVQWKPDMLRLSGASSITTPLLSYLSDFVEKQHPDVRDDESLAVIGGLLELAGHKNPRMRVLEIGGDNHGYKAELWQAILGKKTAFSRVQSWHAGALNTKGDISVQGDIEGPFDVVLIPKVSFNHPYIDSLGGTG